MRGMVGAAARAARISQQLLAFSRQQLFEPRLLDLHRVASELAPDLSNLLGGDRRLVIGGDAARGRVRADPSQVEQVLVSLVANSRDATEPGGRVTIAVEDATLGADEIEAHPEDEVAAGSYVLLSVADTGRGMDAATLAHVFEPFFTTKPFGEGTGLGLSMVYGIVKQHGGQIWAASAPGVGTVFRIYLPAVQAD